MNLQELLKHLKKCGRYGEFNYNLAKPGLGGLGYHRRITDLRKEGHNIVHIRITTSVHKYFYVSEEEYQR